MSLERKLAALAGFLVLAVSPSFVDWQTEPGKRKEMVLYYAVALALLYFGLLSA